MPYTPMINKKTGKAEGFGCSRRQKPKCAICSQPTVAYCDYTLTGGKTCDKPLCKKHRKEAGRDINYCPEHATLVFGQQELMPGLGPTHSHYQ